MIVTLGKSIRTYLGFKSYLLHKQNVKNVYQGVRTKQRYFFESILS